jgi:hypothetical protein
LEVDRRSSAWRLSNQAIHALEMPGVALVILAVGLVLEGLSLRTAAREANPLRGGQSRWSFVRTTNSPS